MTSSLTAGSQSPRLAETDPWQVVAAARAQRGPVVASWCRAIIGHLRTLPLAVRQNNPGNALS